MLDCYDGSFAVYPAANPAADLSASRQAGNGDEKNTTHGLILVQRMINLQGFLSAHPASRRS